MPTRPTTVLLLVHHGREIGVGVTKVEDIRTVAANDRAPGTTPHTAWMTADLIPVLNVESLLEGEV
jgi:hypothetical protein